MARSNHTQTFFAILGYMVALFLVMGLIVGNLAFDEVGIVLGVALLVGVGFTGASVNAANRAATSQAVVAVEPEKPKAKPKAEPKPAEKPKAEPKAESEPDDLTKIEGIGPKMSKALMSQGIDTFAKLSTKSVDELREAIAAEGLRFAPSAESWAEQAGLAASGDWNGLQTLQDTLVSGRYPKK